MPLTILQTTVLVAMSRDLLTAYGAWSEIVDGNQGLMTPSPQAVYDCVAKLELVGYILPVTSKSYMRYRVTELGYTMMRRQRTWLHTLVNNLDE